MKVKIFILLLLFITLSCVSAPNTKTPLLEIDAPAKWAAGTVSADSDNQNWWHQFADPDLDSLIIEMFRHSYDLQAAGARLDMAVAQARIAGASLYPQLGAGFNASRRKQSFVGVPIPGMVDQVLTSTTNNFGASLDISWEIDLWGRLRAGKSAALADIQASQADLSAAKLSLTAQTAKAWFAAVEANRQVELALATLDNYRLSNQQIKARYEKGLRPSLDFRLSESAVAGAEFNLHLRQQLLERIQRQLEVLLGRYPAAGIKTGKNLGPQLDHVPAGLPADLVARRPDLVAAERRLAAADKRTVEAKRALYPRFSLTGSGGTSSNDLKDLVDGDFSIWSILGNIVQPLFQGGRLRAGVDLARANAEQHLALYARSVLSAYAEVENALAAENYLARQEAALQTATDQAKAARQLAEDRYARGLTPMITMLESQRNAFQSESQLLDVRRQRIYARIDLYLALGGGFQDERIQ